MSSEIADRIKEAAEAYYHGEPIMEDSEYDLLVDQAESLSGEDVEVAGGIIPEERKVDLQYPMLSLRKVTSIEDVKKFVNSVPLSAGTKDDLIIAVDPKWDGMACQISLDHRDITLAATRGNGRIGERVTPIVERISAVRDFIDEHQDENGSYDHLLGEIVMKPSKLKVLNNNGYEYSNTRNAVAGILNRRDDLGRELAAYLSFESHDEGWLGKRFRADDLEGIVQHIEFIGRIRDSQQSGDADVFAIDGAVIKAVYSSTREEMGTSSSYPRWAVAYKYDAEEKHTVLREVVWQLGRTGVITPVAVFDPVNLVGANVTQATLHNAEILEEFQLGIGDTISVKRSGDVIPYINEVVEHSSGERIEVPTTCIRCDEPVQRVGPKILCVGSCNLQGQLRYAFGSLGADGIGPGIVAAIIEHDLLDSPQDIVEALEAVLALTSDDILTLPRQGERSSEKTVAAIQSIRDTYLDGWIAALGIPGIGWTWSSEIALIVGAERDLDSLTYDRLEAVAGFGGIRASKVIESIELIRKLDAMLTRLGIQPEVEEDVIVDTESRWSGQNIVITGKLPEGVTRNDVTSWLVSRGASVQGSVTSKTDILIAGEKSGSKLKKATDLGIAIESPEEIVQTMHSEK